MRKHTSQQMARRARKGQPEVVSLEELRKRGARVSRIGTAALPIPEEDYAFMERSTLLTEGQPIRLYQHHSERDQVERLPTIVDTVRCQDCGEVLRTTTRQAEDDNEQGELRTVVCSDCQSKELRSRRVYFKTVMRERRDGSQVLTGTRNRLVSDDQAASCLEELEEARRDSWCDPDEREIW